MTARGAREARRGHEAFLQSLAGKAEQAAIRLRRAYLKVGEGLQKRIHEGVLTDAGIRTLRDRINEELATLEKGIREEAARAGRTGAEAGANFGKVMMREVGFEGVFGQTSEETLNAATRYVEQEAFGSIVEGMAGYHANQLADFLLIGIGRGENPVNLVRAARRYILSAPYYDMVRLVRTTQLWSARAGTSAIYQAHRDIVTGWVWSCALDARVCVGCWSMHGTQHPVGEVLNDHHMGRCAMVPVTRMSTPVRSGQEEFELLPVARQKEIMGGGMWQAWKDGAFGFGEMHERYQNPLFGEMWRGRSLSSLVGPEAAQAYQRAVKRF